MMVRTIRQVLAGVFVALAVAAPGSARAAFIQTNLVSSVPGLAPNTDANLKNPWGVSFGPTGPFWVSNQATGTSTLYNGAGVPQSLVVTIPPAPGSPAGTAGSPTGQVFNGTGQFNGDVFLFATRGGTVAGWRGALGTTAETVVNNPGAVYTGLALANNGAGNFLYAADDDGGKIDVFDKNFVQQFGGFAFNDPNLPAGFTPYNVQNLNGTLYVTYEHEGVGGGVVDAFDANGNLLRRVSANGPGGPLDSPWGLALAPAGFGPFGGALLVGNEGDGRISAFDPLTGQLLGQLLGPNGQPLSNTGLWALTFGNGGAGGDPNTLYFAAGIRDETEGLFGAIAPAAVPEPASLALAGVAAAGLLAYRRRPA